MIIYIISILANIGALAFLTTIISALGFGISTILKYDAYKKDIPIFKKLQNKFIITLIISLTLSIIIPNKKTMATIYLIKNENIQETLKNIPELTKLTTEFLIENLKKE